MVGLLGLWCPSEFLSLEAGWGLGWGTKCPCGPEGLEGTPERMPQERSQHLQPVCSCPLPLGDQSGVL